VEHQLRPERPECLLDGETIADIQLDQTRGTTERELEVGSRTAAQIINDQNLGPGVDEPIDDVRTDEAGPPGHHRPHDLQASGVPARAIRLMPPLPHAHCAPRQCPQHAEVEGVDGDRAAGEHGNQPGQSGEIGKARSETETRCPRPALG
jgi:hypothetical protein